MHLLRQVRTNCSASSVKGTISEDLGDPRGEPILADLNFGGVASLYGWVIKIHHPIDPDLRRLVNRSFHSNGNAKGQYPAISLSVER